MEILLHNKKLSIPNDNRVLIVGSTGSGKTYLARKLLIGRDRLVVIDPKHTFSWGLAPKYDRYMTFAELRKWKGDGNVIYRPTDSELAVFCTPFWTWAWSNTPLRVYIDEITEMTPATRPPVGLRRAIKMGREKKLSVWYASQRPSLIPISLISEAEVTFSGLLRNPDDRIRMSKFTGFPELREQTAQYEFWYCNSLENVAFKINANDIVRRKT